MNDIDFQKLVQADFRYLDAVHWTPIAVIDQILFWLKDYDALKILDIGSGIGKFCLLSAAKSNHSFTGIEIRADYHQEAHRLQGLLKLQHVNFIHSDMEEIAFDVHDVFYLFNPFYEQIVNHGTSLNNLKFDKANYPKYGSYVRSQLESLQSGKLVIFYQYDLMSAAQGFDLLNEAFEGSLQFWRKA